MEIFSLFEDGSVARIAYEFLDADDDPIKIIPISITDAQVKRSAEKGLFAAYPVLRKTGYIDEGEKYCLSYDFISEGGSFHPIGESAGLAFSLKLAAEVYCQKTGKALDHAIAATGVVSDGTAKAEVRRVGGISAKLQAAIGCLNSGDKVFYPAQNYPEVDPEVYAEAAAKGIEFISVNTVAEAIARLLENFPEQQYPVEIMGLGPPISEPGTYSIFRRLHLGTAISVPFKIVNNGHLDVDVAVEAKDDWLKLSSTFITLRGLTEQEISIDIPADRRLRFLLRHFWKCFFRRENTLSLRVHVPEATPYEFFKHIHVKVAFSSLYLPVLLLVVLIFSYPVLYPRDNPCASMPPVQGFVHQVVNDLEWGKYLEAKGRIDNFGKCFPSDKNTISSLRQELINELQLKISFRYTASDGSRGSSPALPTDPLVLRSGDGFKFEFIFADRSFFYVYQLDSRETVTRLFPHPDFSPRQNPLASGQNQLLPADGNFFILDEHSGRETVYFVASRWPARDLEKLSVELDNALRPEEKQALRRKLIARLEARAEAQAARVGGVFYKTYAFQHE